VRDCGLALNLAWLLEMLLMALSAAIAFRLIGITRKSALILAPLFALMPLIIIANVRHYNISFYFVPLMAALAILILNGRYGKTPFSQRLFLLAACVLTGFNGPYTAFFSCYAFCCVIVAGSFAGHFRTARRALLPLLLITSAFLLNALPGLIAMREEPALFAGQLQGAAPDLVNTYGLTLRDLVLPARESGIPFLARAGTEMRDRFSGEGGAAPALGIAASAGLLLLLAFFLSAAATQRKPETASSSDAGATARAAGILAVAFLLLAAIGGISNLAALKTTIIIGYYRAFGFLFFLALIALALALDRLAWRRLGRRKPRWRFAAAALLLIAMTAAIQEQSGGHIDALINRDWEKSRAVYEELYPFIAEAEARLPEDALVFQLPDNDRYPRGKFDYLGQYTQIRPYMLSKSLRWSFNSAFLMMNPAAHWWHAALPEDREKLFMTLLLSGFDAVWIDYAGYHNDTEPDALAAALAALPGAEILRSENRQYVLADLTAVKAEYRAVLGAEAFAALQDAMRRQPAVNRNREMLVARLGKEGYLDILRYLVSRTDPVALEEPVWFSDPSLNSRAARMMVKGWGPGGASHCWASPGTDNETVLLVPYHETAGGLTLSVNAEAFLTETVPVQRVNVTVNGRPAADWQVSRPGPVTLEAAIPPAALRDDHTLAITFTMPDAVSPAECGSGGLTQRLGLNFLSLTLRPDSAGKAVAE
jgi:hypothetical protein